MDRTARQHGAVNMDVDATENSAGHAQMLAIAPDIHVADVDVQACLAMLKRGSKSFFAASRLLPKRMHVPTFALYAFCRLADDEIDLAEGNAAAANTPAAIRAAKLVAEARALGRMRQRLDAIYTGKPNDSPVDRVFAATVAAYAIPQSLPAALLEGMQWDSEGREYASIEELVAYAARVASSVGVMMTLLMGPRDPIVLARAADLGVAMQLTNIARDVGEDARMGRVYLPESWLAAEGLSAAALVAAPRPSAALGRVVARLLAEADLYYRRSETGLSALPRDCRTAIYGARLIYSAIGDVIAKRNYDSVNMRASTGNLRKLWLLLRAYIAAQFDFPPLDPSPPPPQLAFLVDYARPRLAQPTLRLRAEECT
jgi:15-cis-phytoene synthase